MTMLTWLVAAEEWGDYVNLAGCCIGVGVTILTGWLLQRRGGDYVNWRVAAEE